MGGKHILLTVTVPRELKDDIDDHAAKMQMNRSEFVREALRIFMLAMDGKLDAVGTLAEPSPAEATAEASVT